MKQLLPPALAGLLVFAGIACFVLPLGTSEKPGAVYVWGHWLDVPWEVGLPLLLLGAVLGVGALASRLLRSAAPPAAGKKRKGA